MSQLVTKVWAFFSPRIPNAFVGVDEIVTAMRRLVVADIAEDIKLSLGSPVAHISNACALQVEFRLACHVAWIATVSLSADRVVHIANQVQCGNGEHRVHNGGFDVRNQKHVALMDLLESANARTIEANPIAEQVVFEIFYGNGKVLPHSRQISIDGTEDSAESPRPKAAARKRGGRRTS